MNHLANETSPYLLQHKNNPVDWHPWGNEAFEKARREEKPIFLSIGYSTCHWCHVMEKESFEDQDIADYLNAHYVAIKVDKEERPDIDTVYMNVCQALTGSGGWPMTIFMTPDQKPFYAGTYFPKDRKYGSIGLNELLREVRRLWQEERQELVQAGQNLGTALKRSDDNTAFGELSVKEVTERAVQRFRQSFDKTYGGFGRAPKFPMPHNLIFLLHYYGTSRDEQVLSMVETTLERMIQGGIFDHVGYGFSRYATDMKWLAPHFEKMLYDNALLAMALLEAGRYTEKSIYVETAEKTLVYVERELLSEEGGFYSAQDADSEGEEGKYYTFAPDEVKKLLGEEEGSWFCEQYDITEAGNFEGKSIVNRIGKEPFPEKEWSREREKLREYRQQRYPLHRDEKILTSWNGLMIGAFAKTYQITGEKRYFQVAARAYEFIEKNLMTDSGRLKISYCAGETKGEGILDDYAFLTFALLELYHCSFKVDYLEKALLLGEIVEKYFADPKGGYYLNASDSEMLLYRPKEQYDGAVPSGNSVMAWCLLKLADLTGERKWQEAAEKQFQYYGSVFSEQPEAYTFALMALLQQKSGGGEIICLVRDEDALAELKKEMAGISSWSYSVLVKMRAAAEQLDRAAPYTRLYQWDNDTDKFRFFVCKNKVCQQPFADLRQLKNILNGKET